MFLCFALWEVKWKSHWLWSYFCSGWLTAACRAAHRVMSSLSWEGRGGGAGGGASQLTEFQVRFNFHNKPGELERQEDRAKLEGKTGSGDLTHCLILADSLHWSVRTDENTRLAFIPEIMHWEQFLRLTNGKVSRFFFLSFFFCARCGRFCDRMKERDIERVSLVKFLWGRKEL